MNTIAAALIGLISLAGGFLGGSFGTSSTYDSALWTPINKVRLGATNFPTSLDVLTNPGATDSVATISHSAQHSNANDAIEAVQAKLGISASTPSSGTVLYGNGSGSSIWSSGPSLTTLTTSGLGTFGGLISTASSTITGNLTITGNSTTTNATSTASFATTASSTNLYFTTANGGNLTSSGLGTFSNILANGSTTLQSFTFTNATGTNATTTRLVSTNATITNLTVSTCTGCGGSAITYGVTATTTINANEPVMITSTSTGYQHYTGGTDNHTAIGNTTNRQKVAQQISGTNHPIIGGIAHRVVKNGSPTDNLYYTIQTDSTGSPSGTILASGTTTGSALGTACSATSYATTTLARPARLTAGTSYWIVIERTGALHDTDRYTDCETSTDVNTDGRAFWFDGTWVDSTTNDIRLNVIAGGVVPAFGRILSGGGKIIGVATNSVSAGGTVTVSTHGPLSVFSGLLPYNRYYISNTLGAVSLTAGTVSWPIGWSTDTTTIVIDPD